MDMTISPRAALLYKQEMNLEDSDALRLYVRVGGIGSGGFSVGVTKELPESQEYSLEVEGITFYVSQDDEWYFDGMEIDFNEDRGEVQFSNPNIEDVTNPHAQ
ncbi:HesB/YadR/YfhF family protein [Alteribacter aurantiacus]|uniref:HesB/YadR/YfhF family protein n=1 Tax=Alteribacter aurantiacus TaxID=254410 RepID=UPI00040E1219|nr:iron-sulfur cluster biosynthesis family protein [Alteribacter aurantiacus]